MIEDYYDTLWLDPNSFEDEQWILNPVKQINHFTSKIKIMKLFLIRSILIALLWLIFNFVIGWQPAIVFAFVGEYIFEPLITQLL